MIVGSGPAGAATALTLVAASPAGASDVLVLEKAAHPRPKTCAGGLIPKTLALLDQLGVPLDVPNVRVDRARVFVPGATVEIDAADVCRVIRRDAFDAALARAARRRDVEVRERVRVVDLRHEGRGVRVVTNRGEILARVVVGADGSGSLVRRRLVTPTTAVGRAVMADVPVGGGSWDGHASARYEFDFRSCPRGLRGYGWAFPCLVDGVPHANVGAYTLPPGGAALLRMELSRQAERVGPLPPAWKAFPLNPYVPGAPLAAPHVLLVGDAAGVDPLLGEGISFAIEYGMLAAQAIERARRTRRWDFADYERAVHDGPIGRRLARLAGAARRFYGPFGSLWFRLARLSPHAQRIALDWYNGAHGWDGRTRWDAVRALVSGAELGSP